MPLHALCSICKKPRDLAIDLTPFEAAKAGRVLLPLECGHLFDWHTGRCYRESDFPIINLAPLFEAK